MILIALLLAGQTPDPAASPSVRPDWVEAPVFAPRAYPSLADLLGLQATVRLRCIANPDGLVTACEALNSIEGGRFGFEAAAAAIVQTGRVRPQPAATSFEVDVPFLRREASSVQRYSGPEPDPYALAEQERAVGRDVSSTAYDWAFATEDLDPVDRRAVRPIIRRAYREHREAWRRGFVLALAREWAVEQQQAAREGREPDPYGYGGDRGGPAYDQLLLVEFRIRDRARELYCAENPCPPEPADSR